MTYDLYGQYRWWLAFLVCIFLSAPFWHVSFDCGFFFKFFTSETYFQHIYLCTQLLIIVFNLHLLSKGDFYGPCWK